MFHEKGMDWGGLATLNVGYIGGIPSYPDLDQVFETLPKYGLSCNDFTTFVLL